MSTARAWRTVLSPGTSNSPSRIPARESPDRRGHHPVPTLTLLAAITAVIALVNTPAGGRAPVVKNERGS
jgi:hypothetical protein